MNEDDDLAININETVVMISISDKMLFNTGSYRVSNKANDILIRTKYAKLLIEIMVKKWCR